MPSSSFDVIIIGGGINGTGVARDCALRGLKVLLLERNDLSVGATWASSGFIHGGLRYLLYDLETTKQSCIDSGYIQRIVPYLLFRLPTIFPVIPGETESIEKVETLFEAYDQYVPFKNGKLHCRLTRSEVMELEPALSERVTGAVTFDEWGIDATRLCILNAKDAEQKGAVIKLYHEVVRVEREGKNVIGVTARDIRNKTEISVKAPLTLNLSGAWIPKIAEMAGVEVKLRPGKGIHLVLDRKLTNVGIIMQAIDKRSVFIIPYGNYGLIGTTDTDHLGDPGSLEIHRDEVDYLMEAATRIIPSSRHARVIRSFAGVRPTVFELGKTSDQLSREHKILDHDSRDGVAGFVTMLGGKLATYRIMAEELTDLIEKKFSRKNKCQTHILGLPGTEEKIDFKNISSEFGISEVASKRIIARHGCTSRDILKQKGDKNILCLCEPVLESEARYVMNNEWGETLSDLSRRTKFGIGPCGGAFCLHRGLALIHEEKKRSSSETNLDLKNFLNEQWHWRQKLVEGNETIQEELNYALLMNSANIDRALP